VATLTAYDLAVHVGRDGYERDFHRCPACDAVDPHASVFIGGHHFEGITYIADRDVSDDAVFEVLHHALNAIAAAELSLAYALPISDLWLVTDTELRLKVP
jgi:hypothetical protein